MLKLVNLTIDDYAFDVDRYKRLWNVTFQLYDNINVVYQVINGNNASIPSADRTGYNFIRWVANGNTWNTSSEITDHIIITAEYEKYIFNITIDANGGSNSSNTTMEYGSVLAQPETSRTNNVLDGWYYVASYENHNIGEQVVFPITVTGDLNIKAEWNVTVTYRLNGNTYTTRTIRSGTTAQNISCNAAGYTFNYWYSTNSSQQFDFTSIVSQHITLTANVTIITYTISYDLNEGTASNPTSYNVNTNTFTLTIPERSGYYFDGWTGSNGNYASRSVTINKGSTGNRSYRANWTILRTVTFDLNTRYISSVYYYYVNGERNYSISKIYVRDNDYLSNPNIEAVTNTLTCYDKTILERHRYYVDYYTIGTSSTVFSFNTRITSDITLKCNWQRYTCIIYFNGYRQQPYSIEFQKIGTTLRAKSCNFLFSSTSDWVYDLGYNNKYHPGQSYASTSRREYKSYQDFGTIETDYDINLLAYISNRRYEYFGMQDKNNITGGTKWAAVKETIHSVECEPFAAYFEGKTNIDNPYIQLTPNDGRYVWFGVGGIYVSSSPYGSVNAMVFMPYIKIGGHAAYDSNYNISLRVTYYLRDNTTQTQDYSSFVSTFYPPDNVYGFTIKCLAGYIYVGGIHDLRLKFVSDY